MIAIITTIQYCIYYSAIAPGNIHLKFLTENAISTYRERSDQSTDSKKTLIFMGKKSKSPP